ncbi:MAG: alkaline phosphatase D family protein [Alphaproteobacteria bacterium]
MITRRRVLKVAAGVGLAPLLPSLSGCGDTSSGYDGPLGPENLFEHGVASGDPLADAVVLWTRVSPAAPGPVEVSWWVAGDPEGRGVVARGRVATDASRDHTVKLDATGLRPGTTYWYGFEALGRRSPTGRTRTAPVGGVERLRFGVVSCSFYAAGWFHAYRSLADRDDLDLVLHLGDYIYEYGYDGVRPVEPRREIVTLEDYRTRYSQYRRDPDLQRLHGLQPFVTVWDDHESANNSWRGGAQNHDPATEGSWEERRAAAARAYSEWMPIRDQEDGRIFRSFRFGDLVDLVMLDTRIWGRDEQTGTTGNPLVRDPSRQLLGADQEAWLVDRLRESTARWRIVAQQVMMAPLKVVPGAESAGGGTTLNPDQWDGYVAARKRFLDAVRRENPSNLVVLTGDIHTSWANEIAEDPNDPAAYDPATGRGAAGVEFVATSVTSPGIPGIDNALVPTVKAANPHIKWADLQHRGYVVVDVTPERTQGAWFHFDRVDVPEGVVETFAKAFSVRDGETLLREDPSPA